MFIVCDLQMVPIRRSRVKMIPTKALNFIQMFTLHALMPVIFTEYENYVE